MARRKQRIDQADIEQRIREGLGQGRGANYKPWLRVHDVPSQGVSSRIRGWKTGRVHDFLSLHELHYFYILEWSLFVTDIREQYPLLPVSETLEIAQQCGIRHPARPRTSDPIVMTTDFMITVRQSLGVVEQARTVKPLEMLSSERSLEKLEIERHYWQRREISWGIVTERDIPKELAENIAWLHPFLHHDALSLSEREIRRITIVLTQGVIEKKASLAALTASCDDRLGLLYPVCFSCAATSQEPKLDIGSIVRVVPITSKPLNNCCYFVFRERLISCF